MRRGAISLLLLSRSVQTDSALTLALPVLDPGAPCPAAHMATPHLQNAPRFALGFFQLPSDALVFRFAIDHGLEVHRTKDAD